MFSFNDVGNIQDELIKSNVRKKNVSEYNLLEKNDLKCGKQV